MSKTSIIKLGGVVSTVILLSGCAAMNTAIEHRHLNVQTKMSNTVFLPPTDKQTKTIYVDVHNTSGVKSVSLKAPIVQELKDKGYKVLSSPSKSRYILQVNILQLGKSSQSASQPALGGGYGSALSGAALGAGIAVASGSDSDGAVAGGVIGGLGSSVIDDLVTDTTYTLITDVQITAKLPKGEKASTSTTSNTQSGSGTQTITHITGSSSTMKYRTRIISFADKVNLSFDTAKPALIKELSSSIVNIF